MSRRSGPSPIPKTRVIDRTSVLPLDDRAEPLADFLTVLRALHVAPEGLTFHELSSTMAASTLRDTLQELVESGLISVSASARYLTTGPLQIDLSPSQILALLFFPHEPLSPELSSEIASISDDVCGTIPPATLRWVELIRNLALAQSSPPCGNADEQAFETVARALSEGRLLSIQYSSRDGYPERRSSLSSCGPGPKAAIWQPTVALPRSTTTFRSEASAQSPS